MRRTSVEWGELVEAGLGVEVDRSDRVAFIGRRSRTWKRSHTVYFQFLVILLSNNIIYSTPSIVLQSSSHYCSIFLPHPMSCKSPTASDFTCVLFRVI